MTMMYTGHPSQKPWRRVEDAAGNIQVQDNTAKDQSLPVFNTCNAFLVHTTESKNVLWAEKTSDKQSLIDTELL